MISCHTRCGDARRANGRRGYALVSVLLLAVILSTGYLAHALRTAWTRNSADHERRTLAALREAKLALLSFAIMENNTPGTFPCPTQRLDGKGTPTCGATASAAFGRLPWHQLGLMAGHDGASECLWYGVSGAFKNVGAVNQRDASDAVNPAQPGQLRFNTVGVSKQVIAIVVAPGSALTQQAAIRVRGIEPCTDGPPNAFLESHSGIDNADGDREYIQASESRQFNDQILAIGHAELMRPLLRRVLTTLNGNSTRSKIAERGSFSSSGVLAQLRLASGGALAFDETLFPGSPTPANGACPYSAATALHPVSWLCYNGWYEHIRHTSDGPYWFLELPLDPDDPRTYVCRNSSTATSVQCSEGT